MLRVVFAGTPQLAKHILYALLKTKDVLQVVACFTQPDKPAGRGRILTASPVKQCALQHKIPVYQPETLKGKESESIKTLLQELNPDVVVVVAYGLIIPKSLLAIPKYGFINVHMSLLPRWRGAAPIQHAILAGDQETGVTVMQMDEKLDTGNILTMASFPITENDTGETLQNKMCEIGPIELVKVLQELSKGNMKSIEQDHSKATYAHKIQKYDARINWQLTAVEIARQIRAYYGWPVAFTVLDNITIRIWEALPINIKHNAKPGMILQVDKQGINIATGDGIISVQKMQLPNKKPLPIAEIIKASNHPFIPGISFI